MRSQNVQPNLPLSSRQKSEAGGSLTRDPEGVLFVDPLALALVLLPPLAHELETCELLVAAFREEVTVLRRSSTSVMTKGWERKEGRARRYARPCC